jgi:hypothetical protein
MWLSKPQGWPDGKENFSNVVEAEMLGDSVIFKKYW